MSWANFSANVSSLTYQKKLKTKEFEEEKKLSFGFREKEEGKNSEKKD